MSEPGATSSSNLKEWLDNLQQESWQLELIVSGFVIFLLIGVYEPLQNLGKEVAHVSLGSFEMSFLFFPVIVAKGAWLILLANLLIHVVLRGLWISTVGLRYVSQDIDFEALRFTRRFDAFLKKRAGSFDRYIEALERLCSTIFAFTFLLVFMVISFGIYLGLLAVFFFLLQGVLGMTDEQFLPINQVFNAVFALAGLIYFIDFIGLGWLKRYRWVAPWYYPIYRLMGFMTAARLYRPLYYNLIDNRFGRRLGFLLVPYFIFLMVMSSFHIVTDTYIPTADNAETIRAGFYDDEQEDIEYSSRPSIPSRFVDDGFLSVFIPYAPLKDDPGLKELCPDLEEAQFTGIRIKGIITLHQIHNNNARPDSLLRCFSQLHRLYINDSLIAAPDYFFYAHPQRKDQGLQAVLDVAYLPRGRHMLKLESYRTQQRFPIQTGEPKWREEVQIPFWVSSME